MHRWIHARTTRLILGPASVKAQLGRHVLVRDVSTDQRYVGYGWGVRVERDVDSQYAHVGNDDWLGHNGVIGVTPAR